MADTITADIRQWLFDTALPFWGDKGIDRVNGGYVEHFTLEGADAHVDFKRTRVLGRQIYAFSHAALLGWPAGIGLARHGYEFLTRNAWLGPHGGWARRLDRHGRIKDPTPDLYDLAFVLFGLGWYFRATKEPEALVWALRTLDFLNTQMRRPDGVGFLEEKPTSGPRRQNPHMHILEAALVNLEASGDARFRALADEMVELFCTRLFDPATQSLSEVFGPGWSRLSSADGRVTEPGHQFEWAWILANYQRATERDMTAYVRPLVAFAERHGVDPASGITCNAVRNDGVVLDRGSRIWPNTERIQAAVAMFELTGQDPRPVFEASGRVLLQRFLRHEPPGTWLDQIDGNGAPHVDKIPASSLYHLVIAFAEMLRVESAVKQAFAGEVR